MIHLIPVVSAQRCGLLDKAPVGESVQFRLRGCYQKLYDFAGKFHVTLESINQCAVLDDLSRATFTYSENFCVGGKARHIVVPMADLEHVAKMGDFAVGFTIGSQTNRVLSDFLFWTVPKLCTQCLSD